MSVSALSTSNQNYLKAIWSLGEWSDDPVTTSAVAARVGVRMSTASDAVRRLGELGLVEHTPYGSMTLTDEGRTHAVAMVRRHRLIETFLVEVLAYRWDQVHEEADHLEHAVSDFMVERIAEHLGHPDRDPHGDPIPNADGSILQLDAVALTDLGTGHPARVERISDDDPALLQFFAEHGIGVGTVLEARPGLPYSGGIEIIVDSADETLTLGRAATDSVWVTP
ncbi:metal-dependent transcriptional regulator [Tessaracoccus sp. MC1865]|uniref:metal-dependent transcriptional regulator n=1 Tax=Tessaracoccus sp. MC1865 TaxID=2760310 RepID=UPI0015FFA2E1|nr:metal-dependent transcriptional regulator [Tessaracoccus sp. MC1865]MBB1483113.1 metal-dependent transcriptional regulator [Tessaracoccus sp. MC1865]QTO37458.1 metal-dependent transcriptional regulator [Tessaracoccus sp. MC1865]